MRKRLYLTLPLLLLMSSVNVFADTEKERLIAAYIYNISLFTTWPESALSDHFTICIIAERSLAAAFKILEKKSVQEKKIDVRSFPTADHITGCTVVYLPEANVELQQQIIDRLYNRPVLTISEGAAFLDRGGIIDLEVFVADRKFKRTSHLGFSINLNAANQAGIELSSRLLNLAREVRQKQ